MRSIRTALAAMACAMAGLILPAPGIAAESGRWTIADSIAVRYYVPDVEYPEPWALSRLADRPIVLSPDGRHFFFLSFHGDLANDRMVYELQVFAVDAVEKALRRKSARPAPVARLEMASSGGRDWQAGIQQPRWRDATHVEFYGTEGESRRRLFEIDTRTGALEALTDPRFGVPLRIGGHWNLAVSGRGAIFLSDDSEPWTPLERYPAATITEDELSSPFSPSKWVGKLYVDYDRGGSRLVAQTNDVLYGPWISPDGRWAVVAYVPKGSLPLAEWDRYEHKPVRGYRYGLVDLKNATVSSMVDAPVGTVTSMGRGRDRPFGALWSADSANVVLVNTALPISEGKPERSRTSYLVSYAVASREWKALQPMVDDNGVPVGAVEWLREGRELVVRRGPEARPGALASYRYSADMWTHRTISRAPGSRTDRLPALPAGLSVVLDEAADRPPVITASIGNRRLQLTDPDPVVARANLQRPELIEWVDPQGAKARGQLILPPGAPRAGERYPLVVQCADPSIEPDRFRPDGEGLSSGFAAQALAAEGFAVLQMESVFADPSLMFTPREGKAQVERIDSAVRLLVERGLVDPTRVGLVGFSRSGYLTYFAVSHPGTTKIRAAVVFDSLTASYGEYVNSAATGSPAEIYERQYGTGTFWQNKQAWLDAPAFNVERIDAPVLFAATGKHNAWTAFETVGAFRYNGKPFEYMFFSRGSHVLQQPREREAAMQATVDWLSFWIKGVERRDSSEQSRYERWRRLRDSWSEARERSVRPVPPP